MNISNSIKDKIKLIAGDENVRCNEPMKDHTTMKVGGNASCFVTPADEEAIAELVEYLRNNNIPYYVLGNGSNVICRDEGYDGVIICLCPNYSGYRIEGEDGDCVLTVVKSGTMNRDFAMEMVKEGLAGFEFASGIPGSIGGATCMNAGAYDGEIRNITRYVRLLGPDGKIIIKNALEMDFGYRHSLISDGGYIVLETCFALKKDDPQSVQARIDDLTRRRQEKQPLEFPSCGSTFKRPEGFFAGKLISDAGLRGFRVGGAQVSEKHAGFVINSSDATAADVLNLIELVRNRVFEACGVRLECEVKIL